MFRRFSLYDDKEGVLMLRKCLEISKREQLSGCEIRLPFLKKHLPIISLYRIIKISHMSQAY